jgi:hypothetical protein
VQKGAKTIILLPISNATIDSASIYIYAAFEAVPPDFRGSGVSIFIFPT